MIEVGRLAAWRIGGDKGCCREPQRFGAGVQIDMGSRVRHLGMVLAIMLFARTAGNCTPSAQPITLRGTEIAGFVFLEEKPLNGSQVELRSSKGQLVATGTTDRRGFYRFQIAVGGLYQLKVANPALGPVEIEYRPSVTDQQQFLMLHFKADHSYAVGIVED